MNTCMNCGARKSVAEYDYLTWQTRETSGTGNGRVKSTERQTTVTEPQLIRLAACSDCMEHYRKFGREKFLRRMMIPAVVALIPVEVITVLSAAKKWDFFSTGQYNKMIGMMLGAFLVGLIITAVFGAVFALIREAFQKRRRKNMSERFIIAEMKKRNFNERGRTKYGDPAVVSVTVHCVPVGDGLFANESEYRKHTHESVSFYKEYIQNAKWKTYLNGEDLKK